jgi:outer membrane protein assembly factor BamB
VANQSDGTVSKLRASDGKTMGTFNVTCCPYGVAFDGNNVWVTLDGGLAEVRASDGRVIGQFNANGSSTGVAFDGANIWVAISLGNMVHKF